MYQPIFASICPSFLYDILYYGMRSLKYKIRIFRMSNSILTNLQSNKYLKFWKQKMQCKALNTIKDNAIS